MPDDRTFIRVHDGLDEHPKVEPLSDAAFRLMVTTWCYSSRNRTDGRLNPKAWAKRGTPKARRELVAAGLVEVHDDHVQVHDYLEHQRSAADIELYTSVREDKGAYGNHVRWHVIRAKPKKECGYCQGTIPDPSPSHRAGDDDGESPSESPSDPHPIASTETETEEQLQRGGTSPEQGLAQRSPLPPPRRCPTHLTDPAPPPCGACKDARVHADTWTAPGPLRLVPALNRCLIHDTSYDRVCNGCEADRKARQEPA